MSSMLIAALAAHLNITPTRVKAAVDLLDSGATVPFIARYRKEVTQNMDDIQLRELEQRLSYLRELYDRRDVILQSIESQGQLTPTLQEALMTAQTKQELEDLYLPYKPKRRTKGQIACEAGLEPLADQIWEDPTLVPMDLAAAYVKPAADGVDFSTALAVLDGVRDILSERWAQDAALVQNLREWLWDIGLLQSQRISTKDVNDPEVAKFRDYFDYAEAISQVPSHRALAVFRGRAQDMLDIKLLTTTEPLEPGQPSPAEGRIALHLGWKNQARAADTFLRLCITWCWRVKLSLSTERDLLSRLRELAEQTAIKVFADNVRDLLLAAPAGPRVVMGLDPGIRTGVKVAVVDATGKLLQTSTVYPHEPRRDWDGSLHTLGQLCERHQVDLIAIGNGTASRETDKLAADLMKRYPQLQRLVVSEAGASVYSASEWASQEMPDVDVSLRGAASIARRVQDPLAELVKIDPKSIGVGQYQHDINQSQLARALDAVVEDCVNHVGVDLNTASVPLLTRVSGLSSSVAQSLVRWREQNGAFTARQQLLSVPGLGPKTFEQSAGFLRINGGVNPLDQTSVHPESYPVVEKILAQVSKTVDQLMGQPQAIAPLRKQKWADVGELTLQDIFNELEKPGRDPRPDFKVARFNDGVENITDLREGMSLEGTVTNVAAFGAFVDIGVHQDGLVHVSQLSNTFVKDAREIVKTGDIVKVQVLEVDAPRKRISLSMKVQTGAVRKEAGGGGVRTNSFEAVPRGHKASKQQAPVHETALASAFAKLKQ